MKPKPATIGRKIINRQTGQIGFCCFINKYGGLMGKDQNGRIFKATNIVTKPRKGSST